MKVLFVSAEVSPFAKVGGLADVAGALPQELRRQGHDARVVMPLYKMIEEDPRWDLTTALDRLEVRMSPTWRKRAVFKETIYEGMPVGFIGTNEWFTEADRSESVYLPGCMQHLFFSTAVLRAMEELDWIPDVVHCNDWHTGFLPVIMREKNPGWNGVGTVYTVHNHAYQGEFDLEVLDALDLPHNLFRPNRLEAWGRVNFLKAGMTYADQVNTVSETYAEEIQTPEYGNTLDGLMRYLDSEGRLSGIVNGIDTQLFNPETDTNIAAQFTAQNPSGKIECRSALLAEVGMAPIAGAPLVGVVSRLSNQKGMDLMLEAAEAMFTIPIQMVVLGVGDHDLAEGFRKLQRRYPNHLRFVERFDVSLAQRVYAGCDAFLMPSAFEPCGLGQLIALRYGTIPVVRATGGLADTVFEGENGFSFKSKSAIQMVAALMRMHHVFADKPRWARLIDTALTGDYGWAKSAKRYLEVYAKAIDARQKSGLLTVRV